MDESPESAERSGLLASLLLPCIGALLSTLGYVSQKQQSRGEEGRAEKGPAGSLLFPERAKKEVHLQSYWVTMDWVPFLASVPTSDLY